jgi:FkbM family methyltransferase
MNLFRQLQNTRILAKELGYPASIRFALSYLLLKILSPGIQKIRTLRVGPYLFSFENIDDFIGLFTEIFLKEAYVLARTHEAITVMDCGANIGVSLLYFKLRAPNAQVTCFEPNPGARSILEKNIQQNGWGKSVTVVPCALGSKTGTTTLFVKHTTASGSDASVANYFDTTKGPVSSISVDVVTLSSFIETQVDLLKIDIEGPELEVLEEVAHAGKLAMVSEIQLEYHYIKDHFTRPLVDMLTLLEKAGFMTFVESIALPHHVLHTHKNHAYMVFAWRP